MSEEAAVLSVQQSLKQCFDVIELQQEEWKLAIMECEPLISTLSNLAEQLQTCQKVTFTKTPLRAFTDVQERLHYKLEAAMDVTLEKLNEKICVLQKVRDSVSHMVGSVLYVYEVNTDKFSLQASLQRSSTSPSIADMLEWIQDIERFYRSQYLHRKLLLQVRSDCLSEIRSLPHSWRKLEDKSSSKQQLVEDALLHVSFFRDAA